MSFHPHAFVRLLRLKEGLSSLNQDNFLEFIKHFCEIDDKGTDIIIGGIFDRLYKRGKSIPSSYFDNLLTKLDELERKANYNKKCNISKHKSIQQSCNYNTKTISGNTTSKRCKRTSIRNSRKRYSNRSNHALDSDSDLDESHDHIDTLLSLGDVIEDEIKENLFDRLSDNILSFIGSYLSTKEIFWGWNHVNHRFIQIGMRSDTLQHWSLNCQSHKNYYKKYPPTFPFTNGSQFYHLKSLKFNSGIIDLNKYNQKSLKHIEFGTLF